MFGLGLGEMIVLGFVLVVVFSASRMGQLGNAMGKFIHSFRKASKGEDFVDMKPLPPSRRGPTDGGYNDSRKS